MAHPKLNQLVERLASRWSLKTEERQAVLALPSDGVQVRAHTDAVRLGEGANHAYFVVEGLLARYHQNYKGGRQVTALYINGDIANLFAMGAPDASAGLHAMAPTVAIRIPHNALWAAARKYSGIMEAFWRETAVDEAILSQWAMNLGRRDAISRTAHLLCELACRYDVVGAVHGSTFPFPIRQSDLGDVLGLTAIHVNRTLKVLRASGLVSFVSGIVHIQDWRRLVRLAEFEASYLQTTKEWEPLTRDLQRPLERTHYRAS